MRRERQIEIVLILITVIAYAPLIHCDFINYDDAAYIQENQPVRQGFTPNSIVWATKSVLDCNWHPVTWYSHMLDCELFGLKPAAHHLVNLLLHLANILLVFHLFRKMTSEVWVSGFVAALFALHPLQVEPVAWIFERKGVLSTFFGLVCIVAYCRYVETRSSPKKLHRRYYLIALSSLALGLMSKSMLVTWPFVLLLLDLWPLKRISLFQQSPVAERKVSTPFATESIKWLIVEKLPFFALSIISSVVTLYAMRAGGAMVEMGQLGVVERFSNAVISYVRYLGKLFWPADLALLYPHPLNQPSWQIIASIILLAAVTTLVLWQIRRHPFLAFGWFWFLGTLVPVLGLVQIGAHAMADRYMYVPSIGLFVMVAWTARQLATRLRQSPATLSVLGGAVLMACLLATRSQLDYWRNGESLFRHTLRVTQSNVIGEYLLGNALVRAGKPEEALEHLSTAIRLRPAYAAAHAEMAQVFLAQQRIREAVAHYEEGIRFRPNAYKLLNNLAWIRATDPDPAIRNGAEAVQLAERACQLTKFEVPTLIGTLAAAYAENGQFEDAIAAGEKARTLALAQGDQELAQTNASLLQFYRNRRPYHQPDRTAK
jgi:protein O-mannosyl-transferase